MPAPSYTTKQCNLLQGMSDSKNTLSALFILFGVLCFLIIFFMWLG